MSQRDISYSPLQILNMIFEWNLMLYSYKIQNALKWWRVECLLYQLLFFIILHLVSIPILYLCLLIWVPHKVTQGLRVTHSRSSYWHYATDLNANIKSTGVGLLTVIHFWLMTASQCYYIRNLSRQAIALWARLRLTGEGNVLKGGITVNSFHTTIVIPTISSRIIGYSIDCGLYPEKHIDVQLQLPPTLKYSSCILENYTLITSFPPPSEAFWPCAASVGWFSLLRSMDFILCVSESQPRDQGPPICCRV